MVVTIYQLWWKIDFWKSMCLHVDNPSSYANGQNNESNQNIGKLKWLVVEFCKKGV